MLRGPDELSAAPLITSSATTAPRANLGHGPGTGWPVGASPPCGGRRAGRRAGWREGGGPATLQPASPIPALQPRPPSVPLVEWGKTSALETAAAAVGWVSDVSIPSSGLPPTQPRALLRRRLLSGAPPRARWSRPWRPRPGWPHRSQQPRRRGGLAPPPHRPMRRRRRGKRRLSPRGREREQRSAVVIRLRQHFFPVGPKVENTIR